jgi:hypothetical protein
LHPGGRRTVPEDGGFRDIAACDQAISRKITELEVLLKNRRVLQRTEENLKVMDPAEGILILTDPLLQHCDQAYAVGPSTEYLAPYVLRMVEALAHDPKKQRDLTMLKEPSVVFLGLHDHDDEESDEGEGDHDEGGRDEGNNEGDSEGDSEGDD